MRALLTCAVCLLASASGAATEDGDALSLLQMSSSKVSVRSDKECQLAKKAARDARKNLKTAKADHKAAKAALASWKAAKLALKESKEADAAAKNHMASVCPPPEVDNSPDQGCSSTAVNSYVLGYGEERSGRELLRTPIPEGFYGLEKVVPGGGVPAGLGTEMGTKLGVSIMQPCSVAWTTGTVAYPQHALRGDKLYVGGAYYQLRKKIGNVASPCECREKADSVMTWPEAAAVEFRGNRNGWPGECWVYSMTPLDWQEGGFWLATRVINNAAGLTFSCYLGNPEDWKHRLAAERGVGATMDKCRNTALWSSGQFKNQADPLQGYAGASVPMIRAGRLDEPNPLSGTEGGRKLCLKWVKQDEKCKEAVAIQLQYSGDCYCVFSTRSLETDRSRILPNPPSEGSPRNGFPFESCML